MSNTDRRTRQELLARIDELEALVVTDELTGLGNRRGLDKGLDKAMARHERSGTPLSLIAIDVDHFKRVNDTHGHDVGDEVLQRVALAIKGTLRTGDYAFRQGGEEMAVLAEVTEDGARILAEKLRRAIEGIRVWGADPGTNFSVTASFGVSEALASDPIEGLEDTPKDLAKRADQALYAAKENGRNRVESF